MSEAEAVIVVGGTKKHHGISLFPVPSDDPRDPLRWSRPLKISALLAAALTNFVANWTGASPSVAIPLFIAEFQKTPNVVNGLLSYNFLLLGLGNIFWVPMAIKFGKRYTLIASMILLCVTQIWGAKSTSFGSLLGSRCVSGFASAAGESIVPAIVADLFFIHERAAMMAIYVIFAAGGTAVGPLVNGYIIQYTANTWRNGLWLCAGLCGLNIILLFFLYPESNFERKHAHEEGTGVDLPPKWDGAEFKPEHLHIEPSLNHEEQVKEAGIEDITAIHTVNVSNPSFKEIWFGALQVDHKVNFWKTMLHPIIYLASPSVLWAVVYYGIHLTCQLIMIFNLPGLLMAPPYLFSSGGVGLMQIAAIIGFTVALLLGGWLSDVITAREIIKAGGRVTPEQRLISLIPFVWVTPVACILNGLAASRQWSWVAVAFIFGMLAFGTLFGPTIAITYVVSSFPRYSSQCLISINLFKNILAFIFIIEAVTWIETDGFLKVYLTLMGLSVAVAAAAVPLYYFGHAARTSKLMQRMNKWFD